MISQASMTLLQEQVWLRNMSVITGLHRRANEIFLLATFGLVPQDQILREFILINIEIDRCLQELRDIGICDESDMQRMGWSRDPDQIANELGVPPDAVRAQFQKLFEEGKIDS